MEKIIAFFIGLLLGELIFIIIPKIILNKFKIEFSKDEAYKTYRENKALKLSAILRHIKNKATECETSIFFTSEEMGRDEETAKKMVEELRKRGFDVKIDNHYDHWNGKSFTCYKVSWEK